MDQRVDSRPYDGGPNGKGAGSGLSIAIFTHSTNPRGGVVHALDVADAFVRLGHRVTVLAPDNGGRGFFRRTGAATVAIPVGPAPADLADMVTQRAGEIADWMSPPARRVFDIYHCGDGITGNALADLRQQGLIPAFSRTVHHLDRFADPRLAAMQLRAVTEADALFTVSRLWQEILWDEYALQSTVVGNGVDRSRYTAVRDPADTALAERLGITGGPIFLAVGGVEARKNTLAILEAFAAVHLTRRNARLVIAGGASLLDHASYQSRFHAALRASGLPPGAVIRTGPLPDADMPGLYRLADALVFPSLSEGFGLAVLEAMACGTPVVTSRIAPFIEYLGPTDAAWCDPVDPGSIAAAMVEAIDPGRRRALVRNGLGVAARHDWTATAVAHLPAFQRLKGRTHA